MSRRGGRPPLRSGDSRSAGPLGPSDSRSAGPLGPSDSLELDISIDSLAVEPQSGTEHLRRPPAGHAARPDSERRRAPTRRPTRGRSDVLADPNIDKVLGSYRLLSLLGEGGMGRVYCAEHTMLGRKVALKLLRPEYAAKRDAVHRFFQEARSVNSIGHENIVDITDYVELPSGETFFIMELLLGRNLGALIRKSEEPLPLHDAMNIALQVCDALQAAHEKQIVHRDLKPDNVFVIEEPGKGLFVKLLDFGVAKLMGEAAAELSWETAAGSVLGTPAYMSPEQATGLSVDHRTDIYSLGAILYEMFTRQPVFKAKSFGEFVLKHMNDQPVPPSEVADTDIPVALEQIILRCLEKDPDDRYDDVMELREDLARATATVERSIRRRSRRDSTPAERTQARQRLTMAGFGLGVSALAVGAFWFAAGLGANDETSPRAAGQHVEAGLTQTSAYGGARAAAERSPTTNTHKARTKRAVKRTSRLQLLSQPPGANVYRRGEPISLGTTPLVLTLPEPGSHIELVFQLPGHEPTTERVRVTDNAVISVTLEPLRELSTETGLDDQTANFYDAPAVDSHYRAPTRSTRRKTPRTKRKNIRPGETIDPFGTE